MTSSVADTESPREQAQTALTLATVDPERAILASARAEAAARKGWMFDTYLLRRR